MNRFLTSLIITISLILAACQQPAPVDTEAADLAVVQKMYDAFAVGDVETVVAEWDHWEVVDGKAVSFQQYADTAQVLAALQSDTAE